MERRDVAIVLIGALLVAGATVFAAGRSADSAFELRYAAATTQQPVALQGEEGSFVLAGGNVSVLGVIVTVSAPTLPPTATMRVSLTSPDGNESSDEGAVTLGAGTMTVTLERVVAALPQNRSLEAASLDAASTQLESSSLGVGTWTLSVRVSSGSPAPLAGATTSASVLVTRWSGAASPAQPPASR